MILRSACTVWLWVPRDGDKWNLLSMTRNHLWLAHHPVLSNLDVVLEKRVRLLLLEEFLVLLLGLGDPWLRWMFSDADLIRIFFNCSICYWWNCHLSLAFTLPLHWAFGRGFQMRPSAPILQCLRPKCLLSRFTPHTTHNRGTFQVRLSDRIGGVSTGLEQKKGWYSTTAPNGIAGPLNGIPNRLSQGVFSSDMRSWMFRRKQ